MINAMCGFNYNALSRPQGGYSLLRRLGYHPVLSTNGYNPVFGYFDLSVFKQKLIPPQRTTLKF